MSKIQGTELHTKLGVKFLKIFCRYCRNITAFPHKKKKRKKTDDKKKKQKNPTSINEYN